MLKEMFQNTRESNRQIVKNIKSDFKTYKKFRKTLSIMYIYRKILS